ncbi:MAG TPA: hypothetical protein DCX21_05725 [Eubacterium sp.]|nr:hypothetical protein [Eubacterium sp.]
MDKIYDILRRIKDMEYSEETKLFSSGIMDSFDMVMLVNLLMDEYKIKVSPAHINLENFDTPKKINDYLSRRSPLPLNQV